MNKKLTYFLAVTFALSCAFAVQAVSASQLVDQARAEVEGISVEDLEKTTAKGEEVIIIDIRKKSEYETEHIAGAIQMSKRFMSLHVQELIPDKNAKIVVY